MLAHIDVARSVAREVRCRLTIDERRSAAYLGLCLAAVGWRGQGEFRDYAYIVMRNEIYREARQDLGFDGNTVILGHEYWTETAADLEGDVDDRDEAEVWLAYLNARIHRLTLKQLAVIEAKRAGSTDREAARDLGIVEGVVHAHFLAAKQRLTAIGPCRWRSSGR